MHTDPAPLSDDGADLPLIPGPAVSRPSQPQPAPESSSHELLPPFVSPHHREEKHASVEIEVGGALELREEDDSPAGTDEPAAASEPAAGEAESGVPQAGGDDLSWLSAIDWGDDQRPGAEPAPEETTPDSIEEAPEVALATTSWEDSEESAEEDPGSPADLTEVVVEELVGGAEHAAEPEHATEPASGVPEWMSWVADDSDPVDPEPAVPVAADDDRPVVEIESLLADGEVEAPKDAAEGIAASPEPSAETDDVVEVPSWAAEAEEQVAGDPGDDAPSWTSDPGAGVLEVAEPTEPETFAEAGEEAIAANVADTAVADGSLEELAAKLERVARSLRSGSLSEVLAGATSSDPLEVLLAGYALGYARAREAARDQAD